MSEFIRGDLSDTAPVQTSFNEAGCEPAGLDAGRYMSDLDGFEMSDEQKQELLAILWDIMGSFVRLGIDVDICGQIFDGFENGSADSAEALDSNN